MTWVDKLTSVFQKRRWQSAVDAALSTAWPDPLAAYVTALNPHIMLGDEARFLSLDFETTGLDPRTDQIISAGWVPIQRSVIMGSAADHMILDLAHGKSSDATIPIHGLTDSHRMDGTSMADLLTALLKALEGRILLAHHAQIELSFLRAACLQAFGLAPPILALDTLKLERLLRPNAQSYRLLDCRSERGLPAYQNHHALSDALSAAELFLAQKRSLGAASLAPALMINKAQIRKTLTTA